MTPGPGVPAAAQRRVNTARAGGKAAAAGDLAAVAGWLDEHMTGQQGVLFEIATAA